MTMVNQDEEHLRLLSIFHYVVGGITCFFACIPILHICMGIFFLNAPPTMFTGVHGQPDPPPAFVGWLIIVFGALLVLVGQTIGILIIMGGRFLKQRRRYTFCFVVACVECLMMPFGTILGVFTIITLSKAPVKGMFEGQQAAPPPLP